MEPLTKQNVAKHNTAKDAYVIVSGKVYDVTTFITDHPGGEELILNNAGKDATQSFEMIGHSSSARKLLAQYYVGDLQK